MHDIFQAFSDGPTLPVYISSAFRLMASTLQTSTAAGLSLLLDYRIQRVQVRLFVAFKMNSGVVAFVFNHHFSSQRHSGQPLVFSPPRYLPSFLSRIGSSIPTFQLFMLVNLHLISPCHAFALSTCRFVRKSPLQDSI